MARGTLDRHIETTPGVCGGKPRIAGRRVTVHNVAIWHERMGLSPDEIATEHDLSLGDVYAALSWYHDNRQQIDREIEDDQSFAEELRRAHASVVAEKLRPRSSS